MKSKNLAILAAVVIAMLAYILLFERHRPTSEEARRDADKVFQGLEPDDVTGLSIEAGELRVRLEKVDGDWRLREPIDYSADGPTVTSTLSSLAGLKADRVLPLGEVDAGEFGLDAPAAEVTASGSPTTPTCGSSSVVRPRSNCRSPTASRRASRSTG